MVEQNSHLNIATFYRQPSIWVALVAEHNNALLKVSRALLIQPSQTPEGLREKNNKKEMETSLQDYSQMPSHMKTLNQPNAKLSPSHGSCSIFVGILIEVEVHKKKLTENRLSTEDSVVASRITIKDFFSFSVFEMTSQWKIEDFLFVCKFRSHQLQSGSVLHFIVPTWSYQWAALSDKRHWVAALSFFHERWRNSNLDWNKHREQQQEWAERREDQIKDANWSLEQSLYVWLQILLCTQLARFHLSTALVDAH